MYVRGTGNEQLQGWLPSYFGGDYPAETWTAVMQRAMEGLPIEDFPPPAFVDGDAPEEGHVPYTPPPTTAAPSSPPPPPPSSKQPTKEPTTEEPTPTPSPTPTPTPTPTPSPTPSPTGGPPTTPPGQEGTAVRGRTE
jgi:membrane peptidoglycan carboxypeptidase